MILNPYNDEKMELKFSDVPEKWALCFNQGCPRCGQCLHFRSGEAAPADVTVARCITPHALSQGQCPHFAEAVPVRFARGFNGIYANVRKSDYTPLRLAITDYLHGKRGYYESMRGQRLLSPEQQEWIARLFAQRGYTEPPVFDAYEYAFNFSNKRPT